MKCVYCDCVIDGAFSWYGGSPLHSDCYDQLGADLDAVFDSSLVVVKVEDGPACGAL